MAVALERKRLLTCQDIIDKRCDLWMKYQDVEQDREYRQAVAEQLIEKVRDPITGEPVKDPITGAPVPTPQAEKLQKEIQEDPSLLIEMQFVIVNKNAETVPFFLNDVQRDFLEKLKQAVKDFEAGRRNHVRFLILKGRQQGFTSVITAFQLAHTIIKKNFSGMTVSHDSESTNTIFEDKARYPYRQLPEQIKPVEQYNNRKELQFENLNSKWRIATAGVDDIGRSKTLNFFHGSEVAFWDSISKILAGLGQAIAKKSIVILETTANGYNEFKEMWDEAVRGNSIYVPLFYEWWRTPEYRLVFENEKIEREFKHAVQYRHGYKGVDADFFEKLYSLKKDVGLDWKQLYWYFNKRLELKELLEQEYPCTPEEAFLHSGWPYFNVKLIDRLLLELQDVKPVRTEKGDAIIIWEEPVARRGELYCIGADVAEGIEGGDSSSAIVYKVSDWSQVAKIHGRFAPDIYGHMLVDLAIEYNNAYLMIENNNHGWSVLNTVYNQRKYRNIHFTTNQQTRDDKESKKMGWTTNEASKYLMLDELDSAIRNGEIIIRDKEFLKQCREVVRDEKGKVDVSGKDMVVANAIAWQGRKYITRNIIKRGTYSNLV